MTSAQVVLEWDADPQLSVEYADDELRVVVDPALSEDQVMRACEQLESHGDTVLQAWREAVGLKSDGGVSAWAS